MTEQPDGQELQRHGALRQPEPLALGMCWQLIFLPRLTSLSKTTRNPNLQIQSRNLSPPNQALPERSENKTRRADVGSEYDSSDTVAHFPTDKAETCAWMVARRTRMRSKLSGERTDWGAIDAVNFQFPAGDLSGVIVPESLSHAPRSLFHT